MIKYKCSPSPEFLVDFESLIIKATLDRMAKFLSTIPAPHSRRYSDYFDKNSIKSILLCSPRYLPSLIHSIYSNFPELADRFWPGYLLSELPIAENLDIFEIKSKKGKLALESLVVQVERFLSERRLEDLTLLPLLLKSLKEAESASDKKKVLKKIYNASRGELILDENDIKEFPKWVNAFSKVFSYSDLSNKMGHRIIDEWKIDVCLYCNDEGIQSRGEDDEYRTDLDHFYPKAKFPFLSISLYNLVPAGGFCNQKFKKDADMLDCAHPFEEGVGANPLFYIDYPIGGKLTNDNFCVTLWPQNNKLDHNLAKFKIANHYTSDRETKSLVERTFSSVDFILGLGKKNLPQELVSETTNNMLMQIIDISLPAHASRKKKFIVDSVNQFAGKPLFEYL